MRGEGGDELGVDSQSPQASQVKGQLQGAYLTIKPSSKALLSPEAPRIPFPDEGMWNAQGAVAVRGV